MCFLQPLEQFARSPPWLGLEPFAQQLRHPRQRVGTTPATLSLCLRFIGRTHLSLLPGGAQSRQELLDCGRAQSGCFGRGRTVGNFDELFLSCTDVLQQQNRIEGRVNRVYPAAHVLADPGVRQEALKRRGRRVILLPDPRAIASLGGQLEGRLEEVHEQPQRCIQPRQRRRRVESLVAPVTNGTPDHCAVFCSTQAWSFLR